MIQIREYTRRKAGGPTCELCKLPIDPGERYMELVAVREEFFDAPFVRAHRHSLCNEAEDGYHWQPDDAERDRASVQRTVDRWNATNPVGTAVQFWPGMLAGKPELSTTTSEAWLLGGHTPVVKVAGRSDCIALSHVHRADQFVDVVDSPVGLEPDHA